MPLKRKGRIIYHKVGGKWKIKQRCKSIKNAKSAMRLLQGIFHGTITIRQRRNDGIKQRYHKKISYASIEGNMMKIEDFYYMLNQEGIHFNQIRRIITDKDVFREKNGYYYKIKIPLKGRNPIIFNTYSGQKDVAHRYIKAIRMVQQRSATTGG